MMKQKRQQEHVFYIAEYRSGKEHVLGFDGVFYHGIEFSDEEAIRVVWGETTWAQIRQRDIEWIDQEMKKRGIPKYQLQIGGIVTGSFCNQRRCVAVPEG